ncbi:MAG: iron complex transport system ATP-binding protein [Parvibaculaceae bacterium]|jgi:iron complex transport system ATP-binding protein
MIEARQISVSLGQRPVLHDVSVEVSPGEVVSLLGPNGAGKSTLLSVLAGGLRPASGAVTLDAFPLEQFDASSLARRRAVFSQQQGLNFGFQVREVVALGRSGHLGRHDDDQAIDGALEETGAAHLAGRSFQALSGGERQRVHLARVVAQIWPGENASAEAGRFLLLDEPTNNLDLAHQHGMLTLARKLAQRGIGVLCVLHDPNLAALYSDRVVLMENGRIQAAGTPRDVLRPDLLEAVYGLAVNVLDHPSRNCPHIIPA